MHRVRILTLFIFCVGLISNLKSQNEIQISSDDNNYCYGNNIEIVVESSIEILSIFWEVNDEGSWTEIEDGENYQGYDNDTLNIINPTSNYSNFYFRAYVDTSFSNPGFYTDSISFTVFDEFTIEPLIGDTTICYNIIPGELNAPTVNGGLGNYTYQWLINGENINGATNPSYQSPALLEDAEFSIKITDFCDNETSNSISIDVFDEFGIEPLEGNESICYNTPPSEFTTPTANGGLGNYTYQWLINGENINGATNPSYQSPALIEDAEFSIKITDYCDNETSNSISIDVFDEFGIEPLEGNESICYNTTPSEFTTPTANGGLGNYTYQWLINGENINGATNPSYQSPALLGDAEFSIKITDYCDNETSNSISIEVFDEFSIAPLEGTQTICYNSTPTLIEAPEAYGGEGIYSYQWMIEGEDIDGQTASSYQPPALSNSTVLSVLISDFCDNETSNPILINVLDDLNPGIISGDTSICFNTSPDILTMELIPTGGGFNGYDFLWEESENDIDYNPVSIDSGTSTSYSTGQLQSSTFYRLSVISSDPYQCGPKLTNSIFVEVKDPFNPGLIESESICYNTSAYISFINNPTGGFDNYTYQWEILNPPYDEESWEESPDNGDEYFSNNLTEEQIVRVLVSNTCGSDYTPSALINVYDSLQAGGILSNDTMCYNTNLQEELDANFIEPVGGDETYTYQWYSSSSQFGDFDVLENGNNSTYMPDELTETTYFYVDYTSGSNCGTVSSNVSEVYTLPMISTGELNGDQSICYGTTPEAIIINSTETTGGGYNGYSYTLQESNNNEDYIDVSEGYILDSPINNNFSFDFNDLTQLFESKYYRVKTSSLAPYSCGPRYSEPIFVEVYDQLSSGELSEHTNLCFNNSPDSIYFEVPPSGADGNYQYSWAYKTEDTEWVALDYYSPTYYPEDLLESTYYTAQVFSPLCLTSSITDSTLQIIYPNLEAGIITGEDEVCYDESPNLLQAQALPSGGDGTYTYEWFEAIDILDWNSAEIYTLEYQPGQLNESTFYMLEYTSGSECGSVFSNVIEVMVNALPDTCLISGPTEVCANQSFITYNLSNTTDDYNYQWSTNNADFMGGDEDDYCVLHFYNSSASDTLYLEQTVDSTGCYNIMNLPIYINETLAPDQGTVIKKPDTNILITNDSTININYSWGYTDKLTGLDEYTDSQYRYSLMPHTDTTNYWYWVDTYFEVGCVTRSYYNPPMLPSGVEEFFNEELTVYPNPTNNMIYVNSNSIASLEIYNINGELLLSNFNRSSIDLHKLPPGIYILHAVSSYVTSSHKIIKQ